MRDNERRQQGEGVGQMGSARHTRVTVLIVVTWLWATLPAVMQRLTGASGRASIEEKVPQSALAALTSSVTGLLLAFTCLALGVTAWTSVPRRSLLPLAVLLVPWTYFVLRGFSDGGGLGVPILAYALVVSTVWVLRPRLADLAVLGWLVVLTATLSLAIGVLVPSAGIFRRVSGEVIVMAKSDLPWGLLNGVFGHPNNLGQYLALGLPWVFLIRDKLARVAGVVIVLAALVWTSARTSELAVLAAAVLVVLLLGLPHRVRPFLAGLAMTAVLAAVVVLPLTVNSVEAFTNRGYIWAVSLQHADASPWIGLGPSWYQEIGRSALTLGPTVFHGHNQFVQTYVTGGALGVLTVAFLLVVFIWRAAEWSSRKVVTGAFGSILLITSMFEISLPLVDNSAFVPVVALPMAVIVLHGFVRAGHGEPRPSQEASTAVAATAPAEV